MDLPITVAGMIISSGRRGRPELALLDVDELLAAKKAVFGTREAVIAGSPLLVVLVVLVVPILVAPTEVIHGNDNGVGVEVTTTTDVLEQDVVRVEVLRNHVVSIVPVEESAAVVNFVHDVVWIEVDVGRTVSLDVITVAWSQSGRVGAMLQRVVGCEVEWAKHDQVR